MRNWSKYYKWRPGQIEYPNSIESIQRIVLSAAKQQKKIRVIGSGHSFNPLWVTRDILISLDHFQGVIGINQGRREVTFRAGTKLYKLTKILNQFGLALENMGDINRQSIAGAISTGTHGTGSSFQTMSAQVVGLKFINGKGEVISCSPDIHPEWFKCSQISLGAFGIITEVTLKCVPQYNLELIIDKANLKDVLGSLDQTNAANRNFEYYWFPNTDQVMTKISNITEQRPDRNPLSRIFQDYILENIAYKLLCEYGNLFPSQANRISRFSAKTLTRTRKVNQSHKVFTTPRWVRFHEMEYNVPMEAYQEVVRDLTQWIDQNNRTIHFPLEHRFVKADDIYLSPAFRRDSAYIACHVYAKKDFRPYFKSLEEIFLHYDGRPHWGKMHTLTAKNLKTKYLYFEKFVGTMELHDPDQVFLNEYLNELFYEV